MTEEKFHLTWPPWHSYSDHLKEMMHIMKTDDTFTDVTLVSEDGRKVRAHKVVLGASSPIMRDMMTREDTSIVDLKGIALEEINSILQFIYLGEATLQPERMEVFLHAAQRLQIKELCKESEMEFEKINTLNFEPEQIKKEVVMNQANHQSALTTPLQSVHESVRYACNQCDQQFTQERSLKNHIQSKHEGVKYTCNQCDYQAGYQSNLTEHIQSIHEGVKYACNQCDHQYSDRSSLRRHIQFIHQKPKEKCTNTG